jgi:outer membrane protein OmpA-like peptidoglycan-associated protein
VTFIRRKERVAKKQGYRVVEKYALILFDFDSAAIKDRNKIVVDRIVTRMKQVPQAKVKIVGHTDNIGKPNYNLKLSERRAKAVYRQLLSAGAIAQTIDYVGAGPYDPPFDNGLPEGRALNRTVIIYLEYERIE